MTPIYSLLYVSEAADAFDPHIGLDAIVARSVTWNAAVGITGVLIYSGGYFSQYLEGGQGDVGFLLDRIEADPRHHSLHVVHTTLKDDRVFPDWSLAYAGDVGFVRSKVSRLFSQAQAGAAVAGATGQMIALMHDFITMRAKLGPSVH